MKKLFLHYLYSCICLTGLAVLIAPASHAQEITRPHLELEADPLAYILNGYSLHLALSYPKMRYSIGIVGIKQPDFFLDNKAFTVYTSEFDFKTDYLFGVVRGFFAGIQLTYGRDRIGLTNEKYRENLWGMTVGIRGGYRFMFGHADKQYKGFYITPWIAWLYTPDAKTVQRGSENYRQPRWFPFPAVHLGWRF